MKTPKIAEILEWEELKDFATCFTIFNSTFVASKNGVVDGHKFSDAVLQFNKAASVVPLFRLRPKCPLIITYSACGKHRSRANTLACVVIQTIGFAFATLHRQSDRGLCLQFQDGMNFEPKQIKLWPNGEVPIRIEPAMSLSCQYCLTLSSATKEVIAAEAEQKQIGCAIRWFHENSCVRFRDLLPGESGKGHLYITRDDPRGGCFTEEMGFQVKGDC